MTRQSYMHELLSVMTLPLGLAMVEGGTMAALALKTFHVPTFLYATIVAAPMFANLTSFFWARLAQGRPKVPRYQCAATECARGRRGRRLPAHRSPRPAAVDRLVHPRTLSDLWHRHRAQQRLADELSPPGARTRLTSRLVLIHISILALAPLLGYTTLDMNPHAFRVPLSRSRALRIDRRVCLQPHPFAR